MSSAQRSAVKQRPHQETRRHQVATSEPVVLHHGREGGGGRSRRGAAGCFNGLLGGASGVRRQGVAFAAGVLRRNQWLAMKTTATQMIATPTHVWIKIWPTPNKT